MREARRDQAWIECPAGELARLQARLRRERHRRAIAGATGLGVSLAAAAALVVAAWPAPAPIQPVASQVARIAKPDCDVAREAFLARAAKGPQEPVAVAPADPVVARAVEPAAAVAGNMAARAARSCAPVVAAVAPPARLSCREVRELAADYVLEKLAVERTAQVAAHVSRCGSCEKYVGHVKRQAGRAACDPPARLDCDCDRCRPLWRTPAMAALGR